MRNRWTLKKIKANTGIIFLSIHFPSSEVSLLTMLKLTLHFKSGLTEFGSVRLQCILNEDFLGIRCNLITMLII